jgi:hypothetical protein
MQRIHSGRPLSWLAAAVCFATLTLAQPAQAQSLARSFIIESTGGFAFTRYEIQGYATFSGDAGVLFKGGDGTTLVNDPDATITLYADTTLAASSVTTSLVLVCGAKYAVFQPPGG